ncbi:MAG: serine/threonine-protein kinase [Pirellulaceae bacterium]|nr:serine/threonine-protein kinase [Pirellulaceae bacterium]
MNWRTESDEKYRGKVGAIGLSSGSLSWPLIAGSDDDVSPIQNDAVELSATTEFAYRDNVAPSDEARPVGVAPESKLNGVRRLEDDQTKLHLGTGRAVRIERSATTADGSPRFASIADQVTRPDDLDLSPNLDDTDQFILADVSSPSESSDPVVSSMPESVAWWKFPKLRRFLSSVISSAEAGSKMVDRAVGLAIGLENNLTSETQKLLHHRLQITTLLLFFGFAIALVAESFFVSGLHSAAEFMRFWSEVFLTTIMGLISWRLIANCPHMFRNLRFVEFIVFASASWILALNSWVVLEQAGAAKYAVALSGPWQALVFTYALFIPNHWRRALSGIAIMSFSPVMIALSAGIVSTQADLLSNESLDFTHGLVSLGLMSGFSTVAATWGVYSIGSLRSEAFSAKQFNQYRLSRQLGSGGMGEVYVGEHLLLKRPCAIKVIKPQQASDPKMLERFEREVRSTAKLTHWNTVAIYDYGRAEDGTFFYVMEYLPGLNLSQIVKMFGPLPPGRVVHLLVQICDALAEAHHHGMVHRDLKPANIFASKRGSKYDVAKLLDFGLVRRIVRREAQADGLQPAVGSPLYMSPEQSMGRSMDHRSDIYSLAVTAYYLLTGQPPFRHSEPLKVLRAHANEAPPTFESLNVPVPKDLSRVIFKCLSKSPDDRFPDVDSLRHALLECQCTADWNWHHAAQWWKLHRCPEKSQLDHAIEHDQLAEWLTRTEQAETVK